MAFVSTGGVMQFKFVLILIVLFSSLANAKSLSNLSVYPEFRGEQYGEGVENKGTVVKYFDAEERKAFRVFITPEGLFVDHQGRKIDTSNSSGALDMAIWVLSPDKKLYLSKKYNEYKYNPSKSTIINHSSFLSGGEVLAAGKMIIKDGKLIRVNNDSGHYKPGKTHHKFAVRFFKHILPYSFTNGRVDPEYINNYICGRVF